MISINRDRRSPNYNSRHGLPILAIVIHATAGTNSLGHLCNPAPRGNPNEAVSCHYLIDKDGTIHELVDPQQRAWHAGVSAIAAFPTYRDINGISIGIELENKNTGKDPYPQEQWDAVVQLCRLLVTTYHIRREGLVRHMDIAPGRKSDPKGLDWTRFVAAVFDEDIPPDTTLALFPGDILVNRRYQVLANSLTIRQAPTSESPIAGRLPFGTLVEIDVIKTEGTESVLGDARWGHLRDGRGFISMRYVKERA